MGMLRITGILGLLALLLRSLVGAIISGGTVIEGALERVSESVTTKTANYTLTTGDSGGHFLAGAADLIFTLPSTAAGLRYTIQLAAAGLSGGTGLSISPAAADQIIGNGFTPADNKDAILAGASDRAGDCIELVGDGDLGWYIVRVIGTWSREA